MLAPKLEVVSSNGTNSVYNSVKRFSLDGLSDLIRVLMENVDDALFELSDKVDNDRERNMYFEAMREIRLKREFLQKEFDNEMRQCFERFVGGKTAETSVDDDDELTLVELEDLEDSIAIDNMISKARPHFEDDLFAVTERLKAVLRRREISEDENPLDPKAICDSFHNASEVLETDIQVKLIFYKLFDRYVMNNLGGFYRELNKLFVQKGVLPDFKPDQERMKQTTRFMANRIRENSNTAAPGATAPTAPGAMPGGGAGFQAADGNLFATLQQAVGGSPAAAGGGSAAGGEVFEPVGGIVPGAPGAASGGNFVAALTSLQTAGLPAQPLASIDPQSLKAETQQQLIAFREQNRNQVNAADSQTIDVVSMLFDFFFDDEALPTPIKALIGRLQIPILKVAIIDKDFFNQKKHPARKLLDSISRASLGWGENPEEQQALIEKTEEIVNFLINEFEEDISVFEEARINFENYLNDEKAQSEQAEQALWQREQQKDQQIQQAQAAAATLIRKLTDNREISFEVIDFLETIWSSVLFNAYLSLGEDSNHWRNLKRISTTFVWTLIPKHTEAERSKIIKTIPALLRALSKGMDLVKIGTEVQNRIFQMLAQEHAKIVKQTSKNIVTRVDDETVWPEDNGAAALANAAGIDPNDALDLEVSAAISGEAGVVENDADDESITVISVTATEDVIDDLNQFAADVKNGDIQVDEEIVLGSDGEDDFDLLHADDDFLEQAQALEIGSWVEFDQSEKHSLVARLSWKSNVSGNFVFVNRQGHKVRNLSTNGFANELRAGRARCIESSSVFDRAIYTIMSTMQH